MSDSDTLIMSIKDSLESKIETGFKDTRKSIDMLTQQVTKTNGRVTEMERDKIRHDTEVKYLKLAFGTFCVPIIIFLLIKGTEYLLTVI